jgi:pimeloyl-ACP methyl ester carboxylesterase
MKRNKFVNWTKRVFLGFIVFIRAFTVFGAIYQLVYSSFDQHKYPPPGKVISVAKHKLHAYISGQGNPTVILEHGLGGNAIMWTLVQKEVEKFTKVLSYDRAGYGWSGNGPLPRTSDQIAIELNSLLKNIAIEPPYILVGHSFGGYNIRVFAKKYPEKVRGLIFIDSPHEDQIFYTETRADIKIGKYLAWTGILRIFSLIPQIKDYSPEVGRMIKAHMNQTRYLSTIRDECDSRPKSASQVRIARDFGNLPIVIISRGLYNDRSENERKIWEKYQNDLTTLSSNSRHLIAHKSGHRIISEQPEIIVEAIKEMINIIHVEEN